MNRFGDGLGTLLMLAFGLGCLGLVFHGLMDGSAGGAGGASFTFSAKPVKFVLIELFWLGLGLILLLGAWRGVSRQDVDDEMDEDDEVTRPMRRPAEPLSGLPAVPQATRASTVARTSSPDMARPLQPVPVADAGSLNANPAGAVEKAVAPRPLELYTSRFYAVLVFMVFTPFVIGCAYSAMALASVFGEVLAALFVAPIVLAYVATMAQCLRNFFWTGPVLVLDRFGITNHRKGGHLIPWTEVDAARLDAQNSSTYLVLRFRRASDVHAHFGKSRWLQAIAGRLFYKGFEGRVKLTSLVFKRSSVLQTAQAFLRYSRR
jgi:hypothetical protein